MKANKKLLIRFVLFALIFALLFVSFTRLFSVNPDSRAYQIIGGFYQERENSLQAVYIGSSNCYTFWNAALAWNNYGLAVHPFAGGAVPFEATEYVMRDVRKTQPDAMFIVNLNAAEADDLDAMSIHNLADFMPDSPNRQALIDDLCGRLGLSESEKLEFRFLWLRMHCFPLEMFSYLRKNGLDRKINGLKGVMTSRTYRDKCYDATKEYIVSRETYPVPDALAQSVDSLMDYCDEEKIRVLFVTVPRAELSVESLGRINQVARMISDRGYPVLELNGEYETVGMDLAQDYYDAKHANMHGAIKYTNYLSRYLADHFGLENLKGDPAYADWDAAWENCYARIGSSILDLELDASHRDYSLEMPGNLCAEKTADGVQLHFDAVPGADGYAIFRRAGDGGVWQEAENFTTDTLWTDDHPEKDQKTCYRVVPVRLTEDKTYYGNFSYQGTTVKP